MGVAEKEDGEYDKDGRTVVKLGHNEGEALKEELDVQVIRAHIAIRLWMAFIWIGVTVVMIYYTTEIGAQYAQSQTSPTSSINIDDPTVLPMPNVVVCNWNQDGSTENSTPSGDCPTCLLTFEYCYDWNSSSDCTPQWNHTPIQTDAGLFDCYSYNFDPNDIAMSNSTAYSGSLSSVFSIQLLNYSIENRAGCQATFGFIGPDQNVSSITPTEIYNEVNFAPVAFDTFYGFKLVLTEHLEISNTSDPNYNKTRFDVTSSLTTLLGTPPPGVGYVGISFSFQSLSKEEDSFSIGYTITDFFSDFSGMIGTLLGLDTIKVTSAVPLIFMSIRWRSIMQLEDHFNH